MKTIRPASSGKKDHHFFSWAGSFCPSAPFLRDGPERSKPLCPLYLRGEQVNKKGSQLGRWARSILQSGNALQ
jgi:hypothetical protein